MNQKKTGTIIAKKRKEKGLTQEQLADKLGVTNKAVSKWENGRCMPDLAIIQSLCSLLGISVEELLNGEEDCERDDTLIHLLWLVEKLKKFKWVILGLVICNLAHVIEALPFLQSIEEGSFMNGFMDGAFAATKIIGVIIFAYGLAGYIKEANTKY